MTMLVAFFPPRQRLALLVGVHNASGLLPALHIGLGIYFLLYMPVSGRAVMTAIASLSSRVLRCNATGRARGDAGRGAARQPGAARSERAS